MVPAHNPRYSPRHVHEVILSRTSPSESAVSTVHHVTTIVVTHNGAPWLDELVDGVRRQRRQPERIVAVDNGSDDESADILREAFGAENLTSSPVGTGFGAAVEVALATLPAPAQPGSPAPAPGAADRSGATGQREWLWLLHDDCAPDPDALAQLLQMADDEPGAAVIGPKLRDWPHQRRLLEVGVAITSSGGRETGLEDHEFDQGQHDEPREVLAVSTAGMLVRRDVYETLAGFDPQLPLFRDDVDFGWRVGRAGFEVVVCPAAVVYHAEAGSRRARALPAISGRPRRVDRRHAIYTLLVNSAGWAFPLLLIRLTLGSWLRSLGLLLVKWPDAAYDEFMGWAGAVGRVDVVVRARLQRREHHAVPARTLRPLHPAPWVGLLRVMDALGSLLAARTGTHVGRAARRGRTVETGPVPEEAENLEVDAGTSPLRWIAARPLVFVVLALLVLTVIAARGVLGTGALAGGALLPTPDGLGSLWLRYVESWHPVELGSGRVAPPYIAVLAAVSSLVLGNVWLLVDILLLGAVVLAAITGALFVRQVASSRVVRVWATVSYAIVPVTTGAVAGGRLGTVIALIVLPLTGMAALRMVRRGSWSAAFAAGLGLAVMTAFVPLAWAIALTIAVLGLPLMVVVRKRQPRSATPGRRIGHLGRVLVVLIVPVLALLPWTLEMFTQPRLLLTEAGVTDPVAGAGPVSAWMLALGDPGGSGTAPYWWFAPIVLAALVALLRREQVAGVVMAWLVSAVALAAGIVQSRHDIEAPWLAGPVPSWPGFAAGVVTAGLIAATAHGADGLVRHFAQLSFSWRQPVSGVLAVVVAVTPLVGVGWWMWEEPTNALSRTQPHAVPAYVADELSSGTQPNALVLHPGEEQVEYTLVRGAGPRIGDVETVADHETRQHLDELVTDLVSGANENAAEELGRYAVDYVYLPRVAEPSDRRVAEVLDTTLGLSSASAPEGAATWQRDADTGRARVESLNPSGDVVDVQILPAGDVEVDTALAAADPASEGADAQTRRLVLADEFDDGWQATLDGEQLEAERIDGWAQGFALPTDIGGDQLQVTHDDSDRGWWLALQALVVVAVIVLAIPTRARRDVPPPPVPRRRHGADDTSANRTPASTPPGTTPPGTAPPGTAPPGTAQPARSGASPGAGATGAGATGAGAPPRTGEEMSSG